METLLTAAATDGSGWRPFDWIEYKALEGDPDIHVRPVREDGGGVLLAGYATAQPSKFELLMPFNETLCLLEGELRVELEDGTSADLGPGDSGAFSKGTLITWTIKTPIKEFFVLT